MVSTPIVASAQPVRSWRAAHYDRGRGDAGAAVAAGLFGLVLGAAIASSSHHDYDNRDYGYGGSGYGGYGYGGSGYGGYGYGGSGYGYGDYQPYPVRCGWETRAYPGPWGSVSYQQVQVCR
jgi:hypothetical protein